MLVRLFLLSIKFPIKIRISVLLIKLSNAFSNPSPSEYFFYSLTRNLCPENSDPPPPPQKKKKRNYFVTQEEKFLKKFGFRGEY